MQILFPQFFLATISTNCCDDLPLLCIYIFFLVFCLFAVYYALWVTFSTFYFIQLHFSTVFFFFFFLYFNVNKCALCEYYIICQTYSVIQFVHTEFHFVAFALKHINIHFSFFSNEILNFFGRNRSGRGTRNWRMLMNKNAWKKESATHKQTPNKYWNINVPVVNDFLLGVFAARVFFSLSPPSFWSLKRFQPECNSNKEFHS